MYCTVEEIRSSIKDETLDDLIGHERIDDEELKEEKMKLIIQEAIEDADAEIDGYLNKRYSVPLANPQKVINKLSKDIAIYNIFSRRGIRKDSEEENYLTRYKNAIKFLENIAKGLIEIGTNIPEEEGTITQKPSDFRISSSKRLFSRKTLKGM